MFHCRGKDDNKRQRTKSGSSASSNDKVAPRDDEIEVEEADATLSPSAKNIRGAAARNHRKKELREQEEKRGRERADAAGRRKGRAEKRRGDGMARIHHLFIPTHQLIPMIESDPSEEPPSRNTSSKSVDQAPIAATPPATQTTQPSQKGGSHHKRTGRPSARRGRVGRNQWTRDRDSQPNTSKNHHSNTSPSHSQNSKDGRNSPRVNGNGNNNHNGSNNDGASKPYLKSRYTNPQRTSMIEMKRRVAAMLDFINQADRESATEVTLVSSRKTPASNGRTPVRMPDEDQQQNHVATRQNEGKKMPGNGKAVPSVGADLDPERFRTLDVAEMKEMMKKVMLDWQKEFG